MIRYFRSSLMFQMSKYQKVLSPTKKDMIWSLEIYVFFHIFILQFNIPCTLLLNLTSKIQK